MHIMVWMAAATALNLGDGQTQGRALYSPESAESSDSSVEVKRARPATGFLYKAIRVGNETYAYCVYVPPEYTAERAWPAILFLHGSGERGSDGFFQTDVGIAKAIRHNRKLCPAIVVMPQCRPGQWWEDEMLDMALRCVEDASREYHFDPNRVYLTGLSMGGAGAWRLGSRMPDAFAAVVPICGFFGRPDVPAPREQLAEAADKLAKLPIWCFHGDTDMSVPVERSREVAAAIQAAGGNIKYNEIRDGRHNVWDHVYKNPALWQWLFSQKRSTPP